MKVSWYNHLGQYYDLALLIWHKPPALVFGSPFCQQVPYLLYIESTIPVTFRDLSLLTIKIR